MPIHTANVSSLCITLEPHRSTGQDWTYDKPNKAKVFSRQIILGRLSYYYRDISDGQCVSTATSNLVFGPQTHTTPYGLLIGFFQDKRPRRHCPYSSQLSSGITFFPGMTHLTSQHIGERRKEGVIPERQKLWDIICPTASATGKKKGFTATSPLSVIKLVNDNLHKTWKSAFCLKRIISLGIHWFAFALRGIIRFLLIQCFMQARSGRYSARCFWLFLLEKSASKIS
ncbi:hypothetical protein BDZ97DRAFT_294530 [Flammula alnicola]|nr:hypothetical protein BDZ97DRAFT_294530 [Flammula alnicola]